MPKVRENPREIKPKSQFAFGGKNPQRDEKAGNLWRRRKRQRYYGSWLPFLG
jgi:hypothetical protein